MKSKRYILSLIAVILLVFIDQLSKYLIVKNFDIGEEKKLLGNLLVITYITNKGAAWGSFAGKTIFLLVITLIVFFFIFRIYWRIRDIDKFRPVRICFIFIVGGAIGNMIDRIRIKQVVDFISLKFIKFPIFNFADICVTLSVIVLIVLFIFKYKDEDHDILLGEKPKVDKDE